MTGVGTPVSGVLARALPAFARSAGLTADGADRDTERREPLSAGRWLPDWDAIRPTRSRGWVRLARPGSAGAGWRRIAFDTADAAQAAAARLSSLPASNAQLSTLCGMHGIRLRSWTAQQLRSGALQLLWRKREQHVYTPVGAPPAPPPPPVARSRPAPTAPSPQYSTFPPDLDAAAIAQSLKAAARDGVPFCEECRKAQAAQDDSAGKAA